MIYRFLVSVILLTSCNVIETLTDGETKLDKDFFQNSRRIDLTPGLIEFWSFDEAEKQDKISRNGISLVDTHNTNSGGANFVLNVSSPRDGGVGCNVSSSSPTFALENTGFTHFIALSNFFTTSFFVRQLVQNNIGVVLSSTDSAQLYITTGDYDGAAGTTDLQVIMGGQSFTFNDVVPTGDFKHFTIVFENKVSPTTLASLYIDGDFHSTLNSGAGTAININGINSCSQSGGGSSDIQLDSLGIWNRELSLGEIKALANGNNNLD